MELEEAILVARMMQKMNRYDVLLDGLENLWGSEDVVLHFTSTKGEFKVVVTDLSGDLVEFLNVKRSILRNDIRNL